MAKSFILILGGVRSGKSGFAQSMAAKLGRKVLFVATGQPLDEEMASRIEEHKRMRPKNWRTLEIDVKVGQRLKERIEDADVVLLDCLTLLVSNILTREGREPFSSPSTGEDEGEGENGEAISEAEKLVVDEIDELIECINRHQGIFIVVSNEVGLGLVPESKLGRVYRDLLGRANQLLAQHADEVYFMASGIPVRIKG
ncbi:MAG: bifunctional adenosylcobinamide kinase/adenosylcobinamide-phosphate guanylyltransferase [Dehalococcoidia bacterium]|nr:bifunctional adenosylcobinamide kinase/adenosylcobinamide-phosphate guanylyltransferase [Dehalococcoidia bacterium]